MEEIFSQELIDLKQKCNQVLSEVQEGFTRQRDAVDKVYQQASEVQSQAKGQLGCNGGPYLGTVQKPQQGRPILPLQCLEYYLITIRTQALLRIL